MRGVKNVLMHFTSNDEVWADFPIIHRGDGCFVEDTNGKRYLDGLGGLYTTQVGHCRAEIAEVAAKQMMELEYYPNWSLHNPRVLELSEKLDQLAPEGEWSAHFVQSGSEGVEVMLKAARQFHQANGEAQRHKFISRRYSYHGVTMGALSLTGVPGLQAPFEPLVPGFIKVANTHEDPEGAAEAIREAIEFGPPELVAAVVLEPVQNSGGCFVPPPGYWQRAREICDEYGVLLVADATICGFGRIGSWFGVERFDAVPDIITFAKGLTSGYIPMGGMIVNRRVRDALDTQAMFMHGSTYGGHPVAAAVALKNIEIIEREGLLQNVLDNEGHFGAALERVAAEHPMIKEVRGLGYFWAIEVDTVHPDGSPLDPDAYQKHFKLGLHHKLLELGMLCRVDDRDSPVLQFSPALTADRALITQIAEIAGAAIGDLERNLGY